MFYVNLDGLNLIEFTFEELKVGLIVFELDADSKARRNAFCGTSSLLLEEQAGCSSSRKFKPKSKHLRLSSSCGN